MDAADPGSQECRRTHSAPCWRRCSPLLVDRDLKFELSLQRVGRRGLGAFTEWYLACPFRQCPNRKCPRQALIDKRQAGGQAVQNQLAGSQEGCGCGQGPTKKRKKELLGRTKVPHSMGFMLRIRKKERIKKKKKKGQGRRGPTRAPAQGPARRHVRCSLSDDDAPWN